MKKAFVFGKFLPFHKGHEAMIKFALGHCDFLTVLVCVSNREDIPGDIRKEWIERSFESISNLEVRLFYYKEEELPNSSVSSRSISRIWAETFSRMLPDYTLLISSEPYGDFVAEYMQIDHIAFDPERKIVPIAASAIRKNRVEGWKFLPDSVKPFFALKVVMLGTESTGKSTLTARLAAHFNCTEVREAGRDIIQNSNKFSIADLYKVADEHARRIDSAMMGDHALIIVDTDIHITQSYAKYFFTQELDLPTTIYQSNKASLYLYLGKDCPFVQDGTRLDEEIRNQLDLSHQQILREAGIEYHLIEGDWEERFEKSVTLINRMIQDQ